MNPRRFILALILAGTAILAFGYTQAIADPVVRQARIAFGDWPAGQRPLRVILLSDIHVAGPDMPPSRLARIVARINALRPDLVLIAGDFVSDKRVATARYSAGEMAAPLRGLRATLGVMAVLGNHDHWRDGPAIRLALDQAGVRILDNEAVRAGPLVVGGLDDWHTAHARPDRAVGRMRGMPGPRLLLSHSPDPFPEMPADAGLMLAGHTHCGQIVLPLIGPLVTASAHGRRYACGIVREGRRALIVTGGIGTSILPLRIGAPPEYWLLHVGPRVGSNAGTERRGLIDG